MRLLKAQLFLLLTALFLTLTAVAETTLYQISDGERAFLLGGTIHLLHPDEFPLPVAFEQAYQSADALYLEANLALMQDPAFLQKMTATMTYPPGQSLETELAPEVWQNLQTYAQSSGFPLGQFMNMNAGFVSMIITIAEAQKLGIETGIDDHFHRRAKQDGLSQGELESAEDVLAYMVAMSEIDGDWLVSNTLEDVQRINEVMNTMTKAWRQGDMDLLDRKFGKPMRENEPKLYQALLVERNKLWLSTLEQLFNKDGTALVLVGSLHLAGPDSLLVMLEDKGYKVTPYQASQD